MHSMTILKIIYDLYIEFCLVSQHSNDIPTMIYPLIVYIYDYYSYHTIYICMYNYKKTLEI